MAGMGASACCLRVQVESYQFKGHWMEMKNIPQIKPSRRLVKVSQVQRTPEKNLVAHP